MLSRVLNEQCDTNQDKPSLMAMHIYCMFSKIEATIGLYNAFNCLDMIPSHPDSIVRSDLTDGAHYACKMDQSIVDGVSLTHMEVPGNTCALYCGTLCTVLMTLCAMDHEPTPK